MFDWFRVIHEKILAEASKKIKDMASQVKWEGGIQTRQIKEAGMITSAGNFWLRRDRNDGLKDYTGSQGNMFKPDNHMQTLELADEGSKVFEQKNSSNNDSSSDDNRKSNINKTKYFRNSGCQLRTRGFKNSKEQPQNAIYSNKRPEKSNSFTKGCDGSNLAGNYILLFEVISLGDDLNLKSTQKPLRNLIHSMSKEEIANSDKWDSDSKELNKEKLSVGQKEKICQNWMKFLSKLENQMNLEVPQVWSGENIPEFCSNKSWPISELKIQRTVKILKLSKKVILRKALFQDTVERWYCLKWLKAHNDSWYCYYWGQIYFNEDDELESDGKAWICWDNCNKWVSY